jgi:hypothetical protein
MTLLRPVPVPSSQFAWIPESNKFVAEISDIGGQFGRVWDDAADEGLTLVSSKFPGKEIVFVVWDEERDADGDITQWKLHPANLLEKVPFTVTIFND